MTGLLIMRAYHAERGGGRDEGPHPGLGPRHEPGERAPRRVPGGAGAVGRARPGRRERAARSWWTRRSPDSCSPTRTRSACSSRTSRTIARIVHGVGGLVYYDGANLNAILGRCRPGDMGFDIVHINTHKTFATPHGGGGPGAGPVGVVEQLVPYLPAPIVAAGRRRRHVPMGRRPSAFDRPAPRLPRQRGVLVRAYAYVFLHGADGLKAVSELAALNANYLASLDRATTSRSRSRTGARCTSSWRRRRR